MGVFEESVCLNIVNCKDLMALYSHLGSNNDNILWFMSSGNKFIPISSLLRKQQTKNQILVPKSKAKDKSCGKESKLPNVIQKEISKK